MKHVLAVISDLHCGSTVGLHPRAPTPMDDGGVYRPSKAQLWLWGNWETFWERVKRASRGARLHVVLNGDAVDGNHHGTTQIVSNHPGIQRDILAACMNHVWDVVKTPASVVVVRGTEAHVGASAASEESFAKGLHDRGFVVPQTADGKFSHWHFHGQYGKHLLDFTHHGRLGQRLWTKSNPSNGLAFEIWAEHAMQQKPYPSLAIRSHFHRSADTFDAYPTRLIQTPAWQLATAFVHRIAPDTMADIGGLIIRIEDTKLDVEKVLFVPESAPIWKAT